jgi:hypothetical protein
VTVVDALTPHVDFGSDKAACEGENVTLASGYPGANVIWSTNATTPNLTVTSTGTYSVQVTFVNGCSDTDTVLVNINPRPIVALGPDSIICSTETLTLDAGSNSSYLWSNGSTTQTISVNTENVYGVTVTNSFGCTSTDDVLVEVEICSGTNEPNWAAGASVFPNPSSGLVTLRMLELPATSVRMQVYNSLGQIVETREKLLDLDTVLDLSNLPKGMYLLQLNNGSTVKTWRIAVQ